MGKPFAFLSRIFRANRSREPTLTAFTTERSGARTRDLVNGKGLDAEGNMISFESDSERPWY
jgi:hypothetical protein